MDCEEKSNGLAVLWKNDVDIEVLQYSNHHINGVIVMGTEGD